MTSPTTTVTTPGLTVSFADTSDWGSGFTGGITITNTSGTAISNWTIGFTLANAITNIWNAQIASHSGNSYVLSNMAYNSTIAAGQSVTLGFQADGGNPVLPTRYVFNGRSISTSTAPVLPVITPANASVTETSAASTPETFTLTLSAASATPVTVAYKTVDGTAKAGVDYTAASGTVTIAAGKTQASVTVQTKPGTTGSKAYTLQLSSPSGATLATTSATGTIIDPAPVVLPQITAANVTVQESTASTGSGGTLLPSGYLSTSGNQIVSATGTAVKLAAINWYGFETNSYAPQGLWIQNYKTMMNQMVQLGFNAIRLPFSLQLFASSSTPSGINYTLNPDLAGLNGLGIMDKIVAYANQIGLKIILDDHRSAAGSGPNDNGLWYDNGYTAAQWISTWQMLAQHYAGNSAVIGADLLDEPHGAATWGDGSANDWAAAATQAGDAIQAVNPNWLIMVEGIQTYSGQSTWWGGNLMGVASHPITLTDPGKLVYSPHDYPASVYDQSWFNAANYPNNLTSVWDQYWGYIYKDGIAPVFLGEFGSTLQSTSDQEWIHSLVNYIDAPGGVGGAQGISWAYWDWNPTSGDTGGILENDWATVDTTKMNAITPALYHSGTGTSVSPLTVDFQVKLSSASAGPVTVHYQTVDGTAKAGTDYVAESGTLTFQPGETAEIVSATLLGTHAVTSQLTFMLDLSTPSGATLATTQATATLVPAVTSSTGAGSTGTSAGTGGGSGTAVGSGGSTPLPAVSVIAHTTQSWTGGFLDSLTVGNSGSQGVSSWEVEITTPSTITNLWNAVIVSHIGNTYLVGNASYNADIAAGGLVTAGFQASGSSSDPLTAVLYKVS
ncbi:cellulase family glycosylhydrolase [Acidisoma silvae]|uniref:cellulase n=1 Tax=Acidisoma silvae TaxID=2802396 RepID=A0A963YQM8_9PROT|nr:cellulase family glycosylhydrolase [Acidisoma silvae]MCB8875308.1 cellulase family glycosylhydrolase [Acidisoma silvae]